MSTRNNFLAPFTSLFWTAIGWCVPKHWPGKYQISGKPIPEVLDLRSKLGAPLTQPGEECVGFAVALMAINNGKKCDPMELETIARRYHGSDKTVWPREGLWAAIDLGLGRGWKRVRNRVADIEDALANGHVVGIGFTAHQGFIDAGHTPGAVVNNTGAIVGGHMDVIVASIGSQFVVRNAGGSGWGDHGDCYIDHSFVEDSHTVQDLVILTQ